MMQRMKGTLRPGRKAGVLALAVLLLTCVLMAGAVSATDEEWHVVTTFEDLESNLTDGNSTKLGNNIDSDSGRILLEGVSSVLDLNGHTLTMNIVEKSAIVIGGESDSDMAASLTVLDLEGEGKVNATNNYLFFVRNGSTLTLESGKFEAKYSAIAGNANGECSNPTFIVNEGVELVSHENVAVFLPAEGTKARITGATITGKLGGVSIAAGDITIENTTISVDGLGTALDDWTQGPCPDGSAIAIHKLSDGYKGDLTLTLLGKTSLSSNNGVVFHNYISENQLSLGETVVTIEDTVELNGGKITSATYKDCKGDGGVFKDTDGNILLYPSLNQTGVMWSGDATNGYTLSITEPGSYKLMDAFATTGSGIQITADGVTLDGNDKEITTATAEPLTGYILKVAVDVDDTENAEGVTLQKLNITGTVPSGTGNYGGVTVFAGTGKTSVPVTLRDSTIDMSGVTATDSMNPAVYFVSAAGSKIANNVIKAGSTEATGGSGDGVTSRGIVIDGGSGITVSENDVTMGTGVKVSIGIQFKTGPTDVILAGNSITATNSDDEKLNRAIDITTLGQDGESYTITGTKLLAKDGVSFESAVHVIIPSIEEGRSFNLEIDGNTFTNTDNGVKIDKYGTNGITLTGKINTDDFPGKTAETIISAEEGVVTLSDTFKWTQNPEPSYSSSSGNMENAYRVLFNDGSTTLSVQTDLSSGDKLTKPETPVKDGYTFAGWYKDSACTQGWDFETGISGDMTLYAKWTAAGSSGETEATTAPTATSTAVTTPQPTKTQTAAATTSAPQATTAAGVSPTLTQAPAPVAGALFGLLAAGVLLRRRFQ